MTVISAALSAAALELKCAGALPLGSIVIEGSLDVGAKTTETSDSSSVGGRTLLQTWIRHPLSGEVRIKLKGEDGAEITPVSEKLKVSGNVFEDDTKFKDDGSLYQTSRGFRIDAVTAAFPMEKALALMERARKKEITEEERVKQTRALYDNEYNPGMLFSKMFGLWTVSRYESVVREDGKTRNHFEQKMTLRHRYELFGIAALPIKCTTSALSK
jgi:hypothetical protein